MISIALNRSNIRVQSLLVAQWLAILLAAAMGCSNVITMVSSFILAFICVTQIDRATWMTLIKQPAVIAITMFIALSLIDVLFTVADSRELSQALRKSSRLLFLPIFIPLFSQRSLQFKAFYAFVAVFFVSVVWRCLGFPLFRDSIYSSLFAAFIVFMLAHYSYENKRIWWFSIPLGIFFTYFLFMVNVGRVGQYLFIMLMLLFIWQRFGQNRKMQLSAVALLCTLLTISVLFSNIFVSRQTRAVEEIWQYMHEEEDNITLESSMGMRLLLAHNTWEIIKQNPIWGYGTGSFRKVYAQNAPEMQRANAHLKEARHNPHNQYLLTWLELGLPGLLCLLFMLLSLAWFFLQHKNLNGYLGFGLTCAMIIGCTMNSWLLDFTSSFFFIYFAAMFYGNILHSETTT